MFDVLVIVVVSLLTAKTIVEIWYEIAISMDKDHDDEWYW